MASDEHSSADGIASTTDRHHHVVSKTGGCPRCGSTYIIRSRTRWYDQPRRALTGELPYRCQRCSWRGWDQPTAGSPRASSRTSTAIAAAIAAVVALLVVVGVVTRPARHAPEPPSVTSQTAPAATSGRGRPSPILGLLSSRAFLSDNGAYWHIEGEIKNLTGDALVNLRVVTSWLDAERRVVTTHTDGVELTRLAPGEVSRFVIVSPARPEMATFRLEFQTETGSPLSVRDGAPTTKGGVETPSPSEETDKPAATRE